MGHRSADGRARSDNYGFRMGGDAVAFARVGGCMNRIVIRRDGRRAVGRQATGRGVAGDFLAPVDRVIEKWEGGHDTEEIAREFDVSA